MIKNFLLLYHLKEFLYPNKKTDEFHDQSQKGYHRVSSFSLSLQFYKDISLNILANNNFSHKQVNN